MSQWKNIPQCVFDREERKEKREKRKERREEREEKRRKDEKTKPRTKNDLQTLISGDRMNKSMAAS